MSTQKQNRRFTIVTNIVVLTLIVATVTSLLPDKMTYNYLGEIHKYETDYTSVDPETHIPEKHYIHVEYTDKNGSTIDIVDDFTLSKKMIARSNFEYAYSINPLIYPLYWWTAFFFITIFWALFIVSEDSKYLFPAQYIRSMNVISFKRIKEFFGK